MAYGSEDSKSVTGHRPDQAGGGTTLPYDRAFVVQFTVETDEGLERATGRVEHLQTGRRAPFGSVDELLTRIASMLTGGKDQAGKQAPPAHGIKGRVKGMTRASRGDRAKTRPAGRRTAPTRRTGKA